MDKPTIGRIVHFMDGQEHKAAIITGVSDTLVHLIVFDSWDAPKQRNFISQDEESKDSWTWHWPERE